MSQAISWIEMETVPVQPDYGPWARYILEQMQQEAAEQAKESET